MGENTKHIRRPDYSVEHQSWFIPLTQGVVALVDADMVPVLAENLWFAVRDQRAWYAVRTIRAGGRQTVYMHREIMDAPPDLEVDHERHRPLADKVIDNRRENLRICTTQQNQCNRRPQCGGTSAFKGVRWHKRDRKWHARIQVDGKTKHLGNFTDEIAAAAAYDAAALKHFGEFALTNAALVLVEEQKR
jgi:hypothetical protein